MKRVATFACALALVAAPASAQGELLTACSNVTVQYSPVPPPPGQQQNVEDQFRLMCGQVVHALTSIQPTVGIAFSGGNPVLGTATTFGRRLGFFPRISLTARVNGSFTTIPNLLDGFDGRMSDSGETPPMGTIFLPMGSFQGDAAIGVYNGISLGPLVSGLGAVDALASLSFIPAIDQTGLAEHIVNWGLGARVGILKQGLLVPGVSVSGMYRSMGDVSFGAMVDGDPAEFSTNLSTISLRTGISKGILAFDFAAGAGYDIYKSDVRFDWRLECPPARCGATITARPSEAITGELQTAAWNVHANVGLSLLLVNLVGELGYQKATDVVTRADLQDAGLPERDLTDELLEGGRFFASFGIRITTP